MQLLKTILSRLYLLVPIAQIYSAHCTNIGAQCTVLMSVLYIELTVNSFKIKSIKIYNLPGGSSPDWAAKIVKMFVFL